MNDWECLGSGDNEVQYKKWEIYVLPWNRKDLSQYIMAAAPFGGPIALLRDKTKTVVIDKSNQIDSNLYIYNSAGKQLVSIPTTTWSSSTVVCMDWTIKEELCIVQLDGTVLFYSINGQGPRQFCIFPTVISDEQVHKAHIWPSGLCVLSNKMKLYVVDNLDSLQPRNFPDIVSPTPPTSIAIIESIYTENGSVEIFLGTSEGSIIVVDEYAAVDQLLSAKINSSIIHMSMSPGGRYVACFTAKGNLVVLGSDFRDYVLEFPTKSTKAPLQMKWCGVDSILLHWKGQLLMVGPYGDYLHWSYQNKAVLHVVQESDCARVIGESSMEIIIRVPTSVESIRQIGSTSPAAMLFDALEAFESGDAKADENVRRIVENESLAEAIETCIDAAANEFDTNSQKSFLKAASYGKWFLCEEDADRFAESFVDTSKKIRVLNCLRNFDIGLPLTNSQYEKLTPYVLIDRLLNRNQHFLALKICEYLTLSKSKVLIHWACCKVKQNGSATSDFELKNVIRNKLSADKSISFAEIARAADLAGRRNLANMLLDLEPLAIDQVPLLLSMNEGQRALAKACESGNADLIYLVILHLKRIMLGRGDESKENEFFKLLLQYPLATDLMVSYLVNLVKAKEGGGDKELLNEKELIKDKELLKKTWNKSRKYLNSAFIHAREAYKAGTVENRLTCLALVSDTIDNGIKNKETELQLYKDASDEQATLLKIQQELEKETEKFVFLDTSAFMTLYLAVYHGVKNAQKIAKEFKIAERTFWFIKVKALGERGNWRELENFAAEKKSPIGYKPFADAALKGNNKELVAKFALKIPDAERKEIYLAAQMWVEAAELVAKNKDNEMIEDVLIAAKRCPDPSVLSLITGIIEKSTEK